MIRDLVKDQTWAFIALEMVSVEDDGLAGIAVVQQEVDVEFTELVVGEFGEDRVTDPCLYSSGVVEGLHQGDEGGHLLIGAHDSGVPAEAVALLIHGCPPSNRSRLCNPVSPHSIPSERWVA